MWLAAFVITLRNILAENIDCVQNMFVKLKSGTYLGTTMPSYCYISYFLHNMFPAGLFETIWNNYQNFLKVYDKTCNLWSLFSV